MNIYDPSARYRAKSKQRFVNFLVFTSVVLVSAGIGFWLGGQSAAEQIITLKTENETLNTQYDELQDSLTELRAEAQTANTRFEQIKKEYAELIPEGPMQDLTALLRAQLEKGMDPQRLGFFIRSARPPTGCVEPDVRRFVVSTPAYRGPASVVSVADGAIKIQGSGASARNDKGQPEAWFDPAQPVSVVFTSQNGTDRKKGTLPIQHSVVAGNREYRFTIEEGSRSFAKVVFDSCSYP
ncbi:MAG: hypothetical protein AAF569_03445 [Pseudomonadota bacterium]